MREASRAKRQQPVFLGSLLSVLDTTGDLPPAFQELRGRFDRVKAHYDSGELPVERFAGLLSTLRCYDARGDAWTIGASSGLWYKLTDDGWLQSPPPYQAEGAVVAASTLYTQSAAQPDLQPAVSPDRVVGEPESPAEAGGSGVSGSVGSEELLFGLPAQLFPAEPQPGGPVPFGSLPGADADGDIPAPRAGQ